MCFLLGMRCFACAWRVPFVEALSKKEERGECVMARSEGIPLWRRMREKYDCAVGRWCRAQMTGGSSIVLQGCEEILEYGPTCICLRVRDPDIERVVVCGVGLVCLSYHPDAIEVQGCIDCIRYVRFGMESEGEG